MSETVYGGKLSRTTFLALFSVSLAIVGLIALAAIELNRPGAVRAPCANIRHCADPPRSQRARTGFALVNGTSWSSTVGPGPDISYDSAIWSPGATAEDELSLDETVDLRPMFDAHGEVLLDIATAQANSSNPLAALDAAVDTLHDEISPNLAENTQQAYALPTPFLGSAPGIAAVYNGSTEPQAHTNAQPLWAFIVAAQKDGVVACVVVVTTMTPLSPKTGSTSPFPGLADVDSLLESWRWPSEVGR